LLVIESGKKVRMVLTHEQSFSVDTKSDLEKVDCLMRNDKLMQEYISIP